MKINDIAKEIAKHEGKKSQARIGDIKEILGIIADMIHEEIYNDHKTDHLKIIMNLGILRAKA